MRDYEGLIVLGHPRSGTTLLRRLLDGHSRIACPGETYLFSACARFLKAEITAYGLDVGVLGGLSFAGFDDEKVLRRLREFAFGFHREHARAQGKRLWAEKTAFDLYQLDGIERLCGEHCRFVGIVRHGLDVVVSTRDFVAASGNYLGGLHDYVRRYDKPLEAFAHSWVDTTRALLAFAERHPDNCLILRYEDLLDDPETLLGGLLEFVGEAWEPGLIERALGNVDNLGFSDHKSSQFSRIERGSLERWRELPAVWLARLAEIVNPVLEYCDYPRVDAGPADGPEEARRRYALSILANAGKQVDAS